MLISFQSIDHLTDRYIQNSVSLEPHAVHLWGIELEGSSGCAERCLEWLDEAERQRASRLVREQDRRHYVLAHGGLRAILSRYLGVSPCEVSLGRTEAGKPFLTKDAGKQAGITFNLSHAHTRALVAISNAQEVGVDLEWVRSKVDVVNLSERYFSPSEHTVIMRTAEDQRAMTFFRYWVAKEALLKAQGIGLQGLSDCEIFLEPDRADMEVRTRLGSRFPNTLRVRLLLCDKGWTAAVAAQRLDSVMQCGLEQQ
ncbi:MAG: 4'-phosphopantetheinyl transferase superfamily protein [Nitrospira sp.]|nr:4'-phosphopantetheinyl transferase superfamily protein [Nitrospira sp.]